MSCIPRNRATDNIRHSRNRFRKRRWGKNSRYIVRRRLCRLKSGEMDSWRKCICIRICNCNIGNDHHRRRRRRSVPMCTIGLFVKGYPLLNLWDDWHGIAFDAWAVDAATGEQAAFSYGQYFDANHFIPIFFITVACGILSGFHSTQTAIISRTMKSERQGRMTFYNMMVLEGFIAMIWAAAAMGVYNLGLQEVNASLATGTIGVICKDILGPVGGIIALLGVIVLPITSGDTALRSLRLSVSESLHIDQSSKAKRLGLSAIIFALVAVILVFAKSSPSGFNTLWRYFAWSNQTLSLFAFLGISVWMFENSKAKWVWIPLIPAAWYTFVTVTYIANAQIGFHIPWTPAYIIGVCAAVAYVGIVVWYGKKRAARLQKL